MGDDGSEHIMIPDDWDPNQYLTGYANENGDSNMSPSSQSNAWAGRKQYYNQVIGDYTRQAYNNMEHSKIPNTMKDFVKNYFNNLNK